MALPTNSNARSFDSIESSTSSSTPINIDEDNIQSGDIIGKVIVKDLVLIQKNGNEISLTSVYSILELFEDIYATNISGKIGINDGYGGLEKFYISGGEKLRIQLVKPTNKETVVFRDDLIVYRVSGNEVTDTLNTNYTLHFVSESYVRSSKKRLYKSYKNKKIDEIASEIYSEMSSQQLGVENTLNIGLDKPYVCTGSTPIKSLQNIAKRASSYGRFYTFFERLNPLSGDTFGGQRFANYHMLYSFEKLKETNGSVYRIKYAPKTNESLIVNQTGDGVIRASQYFILDNFNHMDNMLAGIYKSRITTLDYIARKYSVKNMGTISPTDANESDFYNNPILDNKNLFSSYNNQNEFPGEKLVTKTQNDIVEKDKWLSKSLYGYALPALFKIQVLIDGSTNKLSVGDTVNFSVASKFRQNSLDSSYVHLDEMYSGYYIVLSIRHTIAAGTYSKRVELGRGTLPVNLDEKFVSTSDDSMESLIPFDQ